MKRLIVVVMVVMGVGAALAARTKRLNSKPLEDAPTEGKGARVVIEREPRLGKLACLPAPTGVNGTSQLGQCYKKPRQWIVLETMYRTYGRDAEPGKPASRFLDQLTFTWHVLLETASATENRGNQEGLPQYSYFTTAVTYFNIPKQAHAASVVLPPSYLERYGEPKAVGLEITNEKGETLVLDCWSDIGGILIHPDSPEKAFWNDRNIMDRREKDKNGADKPMIERRQGLLDRSKTIWALVNPNDYEATIQ